MQTNMVYYLISEFSLCVVNLKFGIFFYCMQEQGVEERVLYGRVPLY